MAEQEERLQQAASILQKEYVNHYGTDLPLTVEQVDRWAELTLEFGPFPEHPNSRLAVAYILAINSRQREGFELLHNYWYSPLACFEPDLAERHAHLLAEILHLERVGDSMSSQSGVLGGAFHGPYVRAKSLKEHIEKIVLGPSSVSGGERTNNGHESFVLAANMFEISLRALATSNLR